MRAQAQFDQSEVIMDTCFLCNKAIESEDDYILIGLVHDEVAELVPAHQDCANLGLSVCWNRRRLAWRRHSERAPWQLEAILCERVLLEGRPQLRIVTRLAGILEDEINSRASCDQFWHDARCKLGKLRRLSQRDVWAVELLIAKRIKPPQPVLPRSPQPAA
jgi:hypothetical protein